MKVQSIIVVAGTTSHRIFHWLLASQLLLSTWIAPDFRGPCPLVSKWMESLKVRGEVPSMIERKFGQLEYNYSKEQQCAGLIIRRISEWSISEQGKWNSRFQ